MKILIIGVNGFLGNQLREKFELTNDCYGADIQIDSLNKSYYNLNIDSPNYLDVFLDRQFDVCINASGSANVGISIKNPLYDAQLNTINVYKMLDAIRKTQERCKFIQISSAAVYGNPIKLPVKEEDRLNPISPYGYNKKCAEEICKMYHSIYNIDIYIVRPFSIYGVGQKKMLLWDLVCKFVKDDTVLLSGTGDETRDYIHVNDFIQGMNILISEEKSLCEYKAYNIANGKQIKIKKLAELVKKSICSNKEIIFTKNNRAGDPLYWEADISRIRELGYVQDVPVEKGINEYVNWAKGEIENT